MTLYAEVHPIKACLQNHIPREQYEPWRPPCNLRSLFGQLMVTNADFRYGVLLVLRGARDLCSLDVPSSSLPTALLPEQGSFFSSAELNASPNEGTVRESYHARLHISAAPREAGWDLPSR